MKKLVKLIAILILIPALIMGIGLFRAGGKLNSDPGALGNQSPERIAHRDMVYSECLNGSNADPDIIYCTEMADGVNAYFTNTGFLQEMASWGSFGLVPRYYHTPSPMEEMRAKVSAERNAKDNGADGSIRFTGTKLSEYEAQLDRLETDSPVALSKSELCDPESAQLKMTREQLGEEGVARAREAMQCD